MSSWKAKFKEGRRQNVTHQVLWGHLPACPATSTKGTQDGPSATVGIRPPSAWIDHPGDDIPLKHLAGPPVPSLLSISWSLSSAGVQTGIACHSTVYIICNRYLGSLLSYWLIKSPSFFFWKLHLLILSDKQEWKSYIACNPNYFPEKSPLERNLQMYSICESKDFV